FEQCSVFHAGVNMIGIVERRLEMPDTFEFPRMLRAVVPLMRAGNSVVNELVALAFLHSAFAFQFLGAAPRRLPGFAAVAAPLNDLPEPTARLRRVDPVLIHRR